MTAPNFLSSQSHAVSLALDELGNVSPLTGKAGQIFEQLEHRFARGYYLFGQEISAAKLAEEFGVSRQPVTVALNYLRAMGYIIITAQVGCRVVSPTVEEITDFFKVYGRMEGTMAALAAERGDQNSTPILRDICAAIERCEISRDGFLNQYADRVGQWHAAIRHFAQSPTLGWRFSSFWRMSDFFLWNGAPNFSPGAIAAANQERTIITEAVINGNAKLAEQLMFKHMCGKPARVGIVSSNTLKEDTK